MIATSRRRHLGGIHRAGIIALVIGSVMIGTAWFSGAAGADSSPTDQITGVGTSASAVTVNWSDGLLGADNKTVVAPRSQGALNADFYNETSAAFKNLKVTVSQTENITHQAISINWSGSIATPSTLGEDYMQIMQCYGDATTGPDPEDCEYGSTGLLPGNITLTGLRPEVEFAAPRSPTHSVVIQTRSALPT